MRNKIALVLFVFCCLNAGAQTLTLSNLNKQFEVENLRGVDAIKGTDSYVRISEDGTQLLKYGFKDGKQQEVLFDVRNTMGVQLYDFDGYIISPDQSKILIQANTEYIYRHSFVADFYIYTVKSKKLEKLSEGGKQQAPQWSPDGTQIAFVRDNNLYLIKLLYDNAESQVTKDGARDCIINGLPDWVNEEEFGLYSSYCFTPDGSKICWLRYDETNVPKYSLMQYGDASGLYEYKYPCAGEQNATVTAWSYDIKSRRAQQLQIPLESDGYIPRLYTGEEDDKVIVYTLNRHQDDLKIYSVSASTTLAQLLVQEKANKYFEEGLLDQIVIKGNKILLPSEWNKWGIVTDVYGLDETTGDIFYQIAPDPLNRQVVVRHKNGKVDVLAGEAGWNSAIFADNMKYFINTWSDANTPYVVTHRSATGKVLSTPIDNTDAKARLAKNGYNRREFFSFTTSEGVSLNGWMLKPANFSASKKYPVIMFQYGGPGNQQVINSWRCGSMGQGYDYYLAQEGYIVVCVDNRGTGGRGEEFEKCTYLNLGKLEAMDQVETALWLGKQSYVNKNAIGIWGWSYGGFNTLMSMSEGRAVFAAGVAVAPPTCFKFYDTIYTERYMRTPQENPTGYDYNAITRASLLSGALLICHGLMDDNVHPQNSIEYSEALVQADKDFKENLYMNRNHGIYGGNTRKHLLRQITNWFDENLKTK